MKTSVLLFSTSLAVGSAVALAFQPPSVPTQKVEVAIEVLIQDKAFSTSERTTAVMEIDMPPI